MSTVLVQIHTEKKYDIEKVATLTGYCAGYIRRLEKLGKIPKSERDEKGWREWSGEDVVKIIQYRDTHPMHMMKQPEQQ